MEPSQRCVRRVANGRRDPKRGRQFKACSSCGSAPSLVAIDRDCSLNAYTTRPPATKCKRCVRSDLTRRFSAATRGFAVRPEQEYWEIHLRTLALSQDLRRYSAAWRIGNACGGSTGAITSKSPGMKCWSEPRTATVQNSG